MEQDTKKKTDDKVKIISITMTQTNPPKINASEIFSVWMKKKFYPVSKQIPTSI